MATLGKSKDNIKDIKRIIEEWNSYQGHSCCWFYPDLIKKIAKILKVKIKVNVGEITEDEFRCGCERYRKEIYGKI